MKEKIRDIAFKPDSSRKIEQMISIVEEYQEQGLRMTARQLYYQFVSRDLIPNKPAEYKKLTALLTDARYAGLVDWDAIEDRGRVPDRPSEWNNIESLVESALYAYRLPRWSDQPTYVELWVEKQALAGVLAPLASEHHVTLMVNKGYSSASAMKESAERIMKATGWTKSGYNAVIANARRWYEQHPKAADEELHKATVPFIKEFKGKLKPAIIFYLGDHDPSGEDMVRDIGERLSEFHRGIDKIEVRKIALTMNQIEQYDPPPNPAKITDPRAAKYIEKYGDSSWEVDALPPDVLARLIREAFAEVIDPEAMNTIKAKEKSDKEWLRKLVSKRDGSGQNDEDDRDEDEGTDDEDGGSEG